MATKKKSVKSATAQSPMSSYFKKVFLTMAAAVGITALTCFVSIFTPLRDVIWPALIGANGMSGLYYILVFGGLGLIIYAQVRMFSMSRSAVLGCLFAYSVLMGIVMMPMILVALSIHPVLIMKAFIIAAAMLACMALFGYKTEQDLSFLRVFLLAGMIGLILVGIASIIWPFGGTFAMVVSAIGVLVFALFTAYDMQFLKRAFQSVPAEVADRLVLAGALHMYISFIAMFQYLLNLMALSRN
ncbi:MAG: Bax inhibitor-1/YccA family protein [Rickettsiales bacterium]|jgi:FtsH-binding integral membrane protein|nr:Bax inhibitor-1/YccA family protein [Rickettsiales bacterium]